MPQKPFNIWELKIGEEMTGTLCGKMKAPPYNKYVFAFRKDDATLIHIWGYLSIVEACMHAPFGTPFRIKYLGKSPHPITGHAQHTFDISILATAQKSEKSQMRGKVEKEKVVPGKG